MCPVILPTVDTVIDVDSTLMTLSQVEYRIACNLTCFKMLSLQMHTRGTKTVSFLHLHFLAAITRGYLSPVFYK